MRACLLPLAANTNATPDPPPGPERLPNALDPTGTGLVPHNYSCFAPNPKGEPFSATFAPRYPDVAPRSHICNSCHSENDPCAAFYYKGMYHYMAKHKPTIVFYENVKDIDRKKKATRQIWTS